MKLRYSYKVINNINQSDLEQVLNEHNTSKLISIHYTDGGDFTIVLQGGMLNE
jgi:hypothetical protein